MKPRYHDVFVPRADLPRRNDETILKQVRRLYPGAGVQLHEAREAESGRYLTFRIRGRDHAKLHGTTKPTLPLTCDQRRSRRLRRLALRLRPTLPLSPSGA